jgi:Flp pilus assembly protein TadD
VWLEDCPEEVEALLRRGWVWERLDQFENAREDYRRAAQVAPQRPQPLLRLGQILLLLGNAAEAHEVLQQARERDPGNPAVGLGLAQSLAKLGHLQEARQLLDELTARHPQDGMLLLERGSVALQMGDPADAESWLRKAVTLLPYDYQSHFTLWQCLRQLDKVDEADQLNARVRRLQQDLERMRDLSERVQSHPYDAALRCEIGQLFLRNGEKREGFLWLQTAVQIDPGHQPAHEALAQYYEESGDPEQAAAHRRQAQGLGENR